MWCLLRHLDRVDGAHGVYRLAFRRSLLEEVEQFACHEAGRVDLLQRPSLADDIFGAVGSLDALVSWTVPPFFDLLDLLVEDLLLCCASFGGFREEVEGLCWCRAGKGRRDGGKCGGHPRSGGDGRSDERLGGSGFIQTSSLLAESAICCAKHCILLFPVCNPDNFLTHLLSLSAILPSSWEEVSRLSNL